MSKKHFTKKAKEIAKSKKWYSWEAKKAIKKQKSPHKKRTLKKAFVDRYGFI